MVRDVLQTVSTRCANITFKHAVTKVWRYERGGKASLYISILTQVLQKHALFPWRGQCYELVRGAAVPWYGHSGRADPFISQIHTGGKRLKDMY